MYEDFGAYAKLHLELRLCQSFCLLSMATLHHFAAQTSKLRAGMEQWSLHAGQECDYGCYS